MRWLLRKENAGINCRAARQSHGIQWKNVFVFHESANEKKILPHECSIWIEMNTKSDIKQHTKKRCMGDNRQHQRKGQRWLVPLQEKALSLYFVI